MQPQRGFALLEALAVIAIVALGTGALFTAVSAAVKIGAAPGRYRTGAALLAAQTLRTAENVWKYGSPGEAPSGTAPMSMVVAGTAVAVTISSAIASPTPDGAEINVTVSYPAAPGGERAGAVTMSAALRVKAPLPGAQIERPGLVPQPAETP